MRKMRLHEAALIVALFVLPGAALAKGPKADQKPEPAKAAKVADEKGKPAKADEAKPDKEDGPARGKSDEAKAAGHGKSDEAKAADHGKSDEAKAAKEDGKADEAKDEKALKADGEGEASVEEQIAREDEKHRERLEKIARLEQIGQEKDNKTLVEKAAMLREKEARRHERKLEKINTRGHAAKDAKDADDHGKKVQR